MHNKDNVTTMRYIRAYKVLAAVIRCHELCSALQHGSYIKENVTHLRICSIGNSVYMQRCL